LKKQGISLAFADMVWNIGPFMVSFLSLTAYAVTQNNALRPEVAFPALTLLNLLNQPLAGFPYAVSAALHAIDSVKRIAKFQQEDEVEPKSIDRKLLLAEDKESVTIKDVAFAWSKPAEPNIAIKYLALYRRTLCCIIGSVGAGKSTLMEALLGGVSKSQGGVEIRGNVAYVAQVPWIFNGSIKENILFGYELNPKFYDIVLEACALKDDLTMLTNGDETQVGGQGMNLSGGQKARVALARAVYARADIYLLDDVLSAVDMHVKTHLIRNVLGPQGLLRDTTRIMTTNTLSILNESDHIIMLENGSVVESGLFENIHTGQGPIAHFLQAHAWSAEDESAQGSTDNTTKEPLMPPSIVSNAIKPAKLATRQLPKRKSSSDRPQVSTKVNLPALTTRSYKTNNWKLYEIYVRASSFSGILLFVLALFAHRLCAASTDVWVKVWLEANVNPGGRYNGWLYIGTYFALGLGAAVCSGTQMYSLLVHCSFQVRNCLRCFSCH
jgi:ABC-type Mn2+/Zn2+ transport system ATPase subunit